MQRRLKLLAPSKTWHFLSTSRCFLWSLINEHSLALSLNFLYMFAYVSGYMSPEYAMDGHFSEKSDVFSFGIIVLEIISGKRNISFFEVDHSLNLLGYVSFTIYYIYLVRYENSN